MFLSPLHTKGPISSSSLQSKLKASTHGRFVNWLFAALLAGLLSDFPGYNHGSQDWLGYHVLIDWLLILTVLWSAQKS